MDWPDKEGIEKDSFKRLDVLIKESVEVLKNTEKRILFHCSAGIGRTGVVMALIHITENVKRLVEMKQAGKVSWGDRQVRMWCRGYRYSRQCDDFASNG